jgi:hypothetical protein
MRFPAVSVPVGAMVLLIAASAQANPACETLIKAMRAFSDQPGIRQNTYEKDTLRLQSISLRDAIYLREGGDGPWRKMPFDLEKRRQMAEEALKSMPPSDCTGPRTETRDGVEVDIYSYKQPDPMKPGQFTSSSLWIGRADGLPRRIVLSETSYQSIEYGTFAAPENFQAPREPRRSNTPR